MQALSSNGKLLVQQGRPSGLGMPLPCCPPTGRVAPIPSPPHAVREHRVQASATTTSIPGLKANLLSTVTRLNSAQEADEPQLVKYLLSLIEQLEGSNPTPRPAESPLINGRWALLYTIPGEAFKQDFLYKYAPVITGLASGKMATGVGVKPRGQFQTIDNVQGTVKNQVRFKLLGQPCVVNIDGPVNIATGEGGNRVNAVFTEANMRIGEGISIPFPIAAFNRKGHIDIVYMDKDLRINKGNKGSYFIARKVDEP